MSAPGAPWTSSDVLPKGRRGDAVAVLSMHPARAMTRISLPIVAVIACATAAAALFLTGGETDQQRKDAAHRPELEVASSRAWLAPWGGPGSPRFQCNK
jgi:hypothetical protein